MVTTVTNNSPQAINTSLFSLQKEIDDLRRQINQINNKNAASESELAKGLVPDDTPDMSVDEIKKLIPDTATPENQLADKDFVNSSIPTETSQLTNDSGFITINDVEAGFVPLTRKVNNKSLDKDITLTASDVGALPNTTVIPTTTSELTNNSGFITSSDSITGNAGTADKAVEVVDYGDTSRTVKIGFSGPSATAKNLSYLAGYTEGSGSSVKIKDVGREELLKWLGIAVAIKYADYRTEELSFSSSTDQKKINLSDFGPDITEENVINFMVIYWTGVPIIASGDWAKSQGTGSSGLNCALHTLNANGGTGRCVVRCVYAK